MIHIYKSHQKIALVENYYFGPDWTHRPLINHRITSWNKPFSDGRLQRSLFKSGPDMNRAGLFPSQGHEADASIFHKLRENEQRRVLLKSVRGGIREQAVTAEARVRG